ncbi:hypothetical protein BHE74_00000897 [Ensete ventricosum]|nr:hypothetical protein BHE74_00000897 [Ensete ventricosum]
MRTPQPARRHFTALRVIAERTGGHVLLHVPPAILSGIVLDIATRAILFGRVRRNDVGEGLQIDALVPCPTQQGNEQ